MDERPGRCPNCGGPLLNTPSGSCCATSLTCSKIQKRLTPAVQMANVMELGGDRVPVAVHVGKSGSCAGGWYTRRIYVVDGGEGYFRRVARCGSLAKAEADGNLWAWWADKLIELSPYTLSDGDKVQPKQQEPKDGAPKERDH